MKKIQFSLRKIKKDSSFHTGFGCEIDGKIYLPLKSAKEVKAKDANGNEVVRTKETLYIMECDAKPTKMVSPNNFGHTHAASWTEYGVINGYSFATTYVLEFHYTETEAK